MQELQVIFSQIVSAETSKSPLTSYQGFPPQVIFGVVAVAVIVALTYYNQVLLKLIIKLVSINRNT